MIHSCTLGRLGHKADHLESNRHRPALVDPNADGTRCPSFLAADFARMASLRIKGQQFNTFEHGQHESCFSCNFASNVAGDVAGSEVANYDIVPDPALGFYTPRR